MEWCQRRSVELLVEELWCLVWWVLAPGWLVAGVGAAWWIWQVVGSLRRSERAMRGLGRKRGRGGGCGEVWRADTEMGAAGWHQQHLLLALWLLEAEALVAWRWWSEPGLA